MVILLGEIEYNQQLWWYERPVAQNTMGNSTKYQAGIDQSFWGM